MSAIATIRILCETDPFVGDSRRQRPARVGDRPGRMHGVLLGTAGSRRRVHPRQARAPVETIDRWLAVGFLVGMPLGFLMFVVCVAGLVS